LTHYTQEVPDYDLDQGFESLSRLLETGRSEVPEAEVLGRNAVEKRSRELVEQDIEPYWGDEIESLRELRRVHEINV